MRNGCETTCALCPSGCGLEVRVVGGRAVKVEGNPLHPLNQGVCCLRGQAALEMLYSPERIRHPLIRSTPRRPLRSPETSKVSPFREASWDEALALVAGKLRELRSGRPGAGGRLPARRDARLAAAAGRPLHGRLRLAERDCTPLAAGPASPGGDVPVAGHQRPAGLRPEQRQIRHHVRRQPAGDQPPRHRLPGGDRVHAPRPAAARQAGRRQPAPGPDRRQGRRVGSHPPRHVWRAGAGDGERHHQQRPLRQGFHAGLHLRLRGFRRRRGAAATRASSRSCWSSTP